MENKTNYFKEWEGLFIQYRPYLISFAFRMTGSLSEAEDIVQDTFLQCAPFDPKEIQSPKSWLTKICSNKALDYMKLAYKKREVYPGVWLPDAVPESLQFWSHLKDDVNPDKKLLQSESLTTSFLLMLQKLNPEERVIYLLNEIFDYSFKEIAEFMSKTEDACKKMCQRARKAFESEKRYNTYSKSDQSLIQQFFDVASSGDKDLLATFLTDDSEFWGDGGGKASVASKEIVMDLPFIAKFFSAIWSGPLTKKPNMRQEYMMVNERPGTVISRQDDDGVWRFESIMSFEIENGKIARIYVQRNPDKLENLLKA